MPFSSNYLFSSVLVSSSARRSLLSLLLLLPTLLLAGEISGVDRILVLVNDEIIMKSELEGELSSFITKLQQRGSPVPPIQTLAQQVLEQMISQRLQLQAADRAGIRADELTIDQALESIARRNNLSLSGLRDALQREGVVFQQFREGIRQEIILEKLKMSQIENRVIVTDGEAERLAQQLAADNSEELRQYRLGHILIPLPEGASPEQIQEARERVEKVLQQLQQGEDFQQTAMKQSAGSQALEGWVLEWRTRAELPTLFARQLPALQSTAVVGPIRSASGFHLLSLLDSREQTLKHSVTLTRARHILLKPTPLLSDDKLREKLALIRERVIGGESFEELARINSEDGSASEGGDLGWQNPVNLVPEFVRQMEQLQQSGDLSPVFKSRFGWHLVQLVGRKQQDDTEDHLLNEARNMIRKRKESEATEAWLRRLRDDAYIEYRLDDI